MRAGVGAAALAAYARPAQALMYDTFSPELLKPSECSGGCAEWSGHDASIWRGGKVPDGAGSKCAQVGSLVNSRTLGPWCYCSTSTPPPAPAPADHPLDGKTLALRNAADSKYISFAYTDAPPGLSASTEWIRGGYSSTDAMPLLFKAVSGQPHTYTMYNEWPGYENWVSFTWSDNYMRAYYGESSAMPTQFVSQGDGKYVMINQYPDARGQGKYVNMDNASWLQTEATSAEDALVVTVEPADAPGGGSWGYCTHAKAVPEQVNVQVASPDSVVVSWVTFEDTAPTGAPTLYIGESAGSLSPVQGVTHVHKTSAGDRTYYMHFVRASKLSPRARYSYKVKSGGSGAAESDLFTFRAPYADGPTKIDIYGDMGVYEYNNMEQLYADCVTGKAADAIIHMGDHAYNEGDSDERRADGYFNAFQKTIANCPWMPVVGNHEYYAGAQLGRYLDSTWEKWGPIAGGDVAGNEFAAGPVKSTATTALGALLTTATHHGAGTLGANPSGTSRYFSADLGLVHLVALDMNMYFGVDPCGDSCKTAQLAWLEEDLKAANQNREKVPWVAAFSHYPLYCSGCNSNQVSAPYYASDAAETWGNGNVTASAVWAKRHGASGANVGASSNAIIADFQPIFDKYSVDIYLAGHWHYYESLWPATKGKDSCPACAEPTQKTFNSPKVTTHVTTGNGGPPGKDTFCEAGSSAPDCNTIPATRKQTNEYSYGRMVAHNKTHLTFQQFLNSDGSLFDEWTIVQPKHPF